MDRAMQEGVPGQAAAAPPRQIPPLTDSELRAVAYFAIGVGSEGSVGGRDVSNRLSFAGTFRNGLMIPEGNSGFSIGTLQTDLGQHPEVVPPLINAYQSWARANHPNLILSDEESARATMDLGRNGQAIRQQQNRALNAGVKSQLDAFLCSEDGITFIHERDVAQVEELMTGVMARMRQTSLYRNAEPDDQVRLATIVAKVQNQSGDLWTPTLLRGMDDGTHTSIEDVSRAVDGLRPRVNGPADYMESGRDHALAGAEVLIALRNADQNNPLHGAWQSVLANPLVNPNQLDRDVVHPHLGAEYKTIKTLFLQKAQAPAFIDALERGGAYAYGRPQQEGNRAPTAGLYAMGDDFVVWNRDGAGHSRIGGVWSDVTRQDLSRTRNADGSTDLDLARNGIRTRLLHVDPRTPELRASFAPDPQIRDASRFENPMFQQARTAVHRLDASMGRTPDQASERMSASLACLALANGLCRIDHVVLGRQGENVFIVQGRLEDPAHMRAHMTTDLATQTPTDESLQRLEQLDRQLAEQHARQASLQEQHAQQSDAPRRTL